MMRRFHTEVELAEYEAQTTWRGFLVAALERLSLGRWFVRPVLLVPLVAALFALRRGVDWLPLIVCVWLAVAHVTLTPWFRIQYLAPVMPAFIAMVVIGLHRLERIRLGRTHVGAALATAVVIAHVYNGVAFAVQYNRQPRATPGPERAAFVESMHARPGRHLVLVRYGPGHQPTAEWVFNSASIDEQRVVFAREMGGGRDAPLLDYFKDRQAWLLEVDRAAGRTTTLLTRLR